jgi:hypothetical protein
VLEPHRGDRQHREAVGADQERILVGAVRRAAVLDDAQAPRRDLVDDAVVEQDHAVGDVFLEAVAGERVLAALAGDDGVTPRSFSQRKSGRSSARRMPWLGRPANSASIVSRHDPLGADRVDRVAEADEQALEVVLAGLLDLAALDVDEVERDLLLPHQLVEVEAERAHVGGELGGALLEGHEDPGSPSSVAPRTMNSAASIVLPQPAPPQTSVGRPRGTPPPVISSSP